MLQNHSERPANRPEDVKAQSLPNAVALSSAIRRSSPEARIVYYVTWGRNNGDGERCDYYPKVCTFEGQTQAIVDGYTQYAETTGGELALVGPAWMDVMTDPDAPPEARDLWAPDGGHSSLAGSYLAACVFHRRLYGHSPVGITFTAGLSDRVALYLQGVAERAAGERPARE